MLTRTVFYEETGWPLLAGLIGLYLSRVEWDTPEGLTAIGLL